MRKLVYIAGPYSSEPEANVDKAMMVANILLDQKFAIFCPHLFHFLEQVQERDYQEWLELDLQYLSNCDAILRLEGESPGADKEVAHAVNQEIPVFYECYFKDIESACKQMREILEWK